MIYIYINKEIMYYTPFIFILHTNIISYMSNLNWWNRNLKNKLPDTTHNLKQKNNLLFGYAENGGKQN